MIESIRVDDRLIHGQVALVWTKEFNARHIVIANDKAANDKIAQMTLEMATPSGIKLLIKSVSDSIAVFNDERIKDTPLFVLTANISDALFIAENCELKSINVANVGRFDDSDDTEDMEDKIKLSPQIFVNQKEMSALKKLVTMDLDVHNQIVPSDQKKNIKTLLKNYL